MPSGVKSYSTTAANNVLANTGIQADEGCPPSSVNDSMRQMMADTRTEWAESSVASSTTGSVDTSVAGYLHLTNAVTFASLGSVSAGIRRRIVFDTVTPLANSANLILVGGANRTSSPGDVSEFISEGGGIWRETNFQAVGTIGGGVMAGLFTTVNAGSTVRASVHAGTNASFGASVYGGSALAWGTGTSSYGMIVKRKSADQSVANSTTLANDNDLAFSIAANEEWTADFFLSAGDSLGAAGGIKVGVVTPSGATLEANAILIAGVGVGTAQGRSTTSGGTLISVTPVGASAGYVRVSVWVLNGANAGSVTLQWAQAASNATATVLHKGSWMNAIRVA